MDHYQGSNPDAWAAHLDAQTVKAMRREGDDRGPVACYICGGDLEDCGHWRRLDDGTCPEYRHYAPAL